MKRLYLILFILIQGCSMSEQNDFVELKDLGTTTLGGVYYKLYQTGIDNYRYEFYLIDKADTIDIFKVSLNDATYKNIKVSIQEQRDTIKIKTNWDLGKQLKVIENKVFLFSKI